MDIFGPIDDIVSGAAGAAVKVVKKGAKRAADRAQDWGSQVANRAQYAQSNPLGFIGSAVTEGLKNSGAGGVRYAAYIGENAVKTAKGQQTLGQARKNIRNAIAIDAAIDAASAATGYVGGAVVRAGVKPGLRHSINAAENLLRGERVVLTSTSAPMSLVKSAPSAAFTDVTTGAIKAIDPRNFYPISEYRMGMENAPPDWHPIDIWKREERATNIGDMLNEWAQTNRTSITPDPRNKYAQIGKILPMGSPTMGSATVKPEKLRPYVSDVKGGPAARPAAPGVHMISPYEVFNRQFKFRRPLAQNVRDWPLVDDYPGWVSVGRSPGEDIREFTIPGWDNDQLNASLGRAAAAGATYYQAGGVADKFFLPSGTRYTNRAALEVPLAAATAAGAKKKNTKRNVR